MGCKGGGVSGRLIRHGFHEIDVASYPCRSLTGLLKATPEDLTRRNRRSEGRRGRLGEHDLIQGHGTPILRDAPPSPWPSQVVVERLGASLRNGFALAMGGGYGDRARHKIFDA